MKSTNTSIILYTVPSYYSNLLENILEKIRTQSEIKFNLSYSNVKYRRMWDTSLRDYDKKFNLEKGKWTDFILLAGSYNENNITKINPFTIHELYVIKLKVALLLFWRDIANHLSSDTVFKLQLKLNLTFTSENSNESQNLNINMNKIDQIRSIGSVIVYTNKNFEEALIYLQHSLDLIVNNYSSFFIKSIILSYNICYDDSILKKVKISDEVLKLINESQTSKSEKTNKEQLKINDKNLPLTTDLSEWGDISLIKGDYPYKFNLKESKVLINTK